MFNFYIGGGQCVPVTQLDDYTLEVWFVHLRKCALGLVRHKLKQRYLVGATAALEAEIRARMNEV